MNLQRTTLAELKVLPGKPARLHNRSTHQTDTQWLDQDGQTTSRRLAKRDLLLFKEELAAAQELLYASSSYGLLVVLQALDAAGKDGTIKHVMSGVNPQGCEVTAFKAPSAEELSHDFLWRCVKSLPARGRIGIFNRSYYEDVLVTRVHPELLLAQHLPSDAGHGEGLWKKRFDDINAFERHLHRNGTRVVKIFLHLSKDEQKRRFLDRLDEEDKAWKFSSSDLAERAYFDDYQQAYEKMITATSTAWAPWYVIPADQKFLARSLVAGILVDVISELDLKFPKISKSERTALDQARQALLEE